MSRKCADRDAEGQRWVDAFGVLGPPPTALDEEDWREAGRLAHDHGRNAAGELRQFAAARAAGDRRRDLAGVRAPTLVIHGAADPMTSPRAGRATADAIPGARFVLCPGLGHGLPRAFWPVVVDEISTVAAHVESGAAQP